MLEFQKKTLKKVEDKKPILRLDIFVYTSSVGE